MGFQLLPRIHFQFRLIHWIFAVYRKLTLTCRCELNFLIFFLTLSPSLSSLLSFFTARDSQKSHKPVTFFPIWSYPFSRYFIVWCADSSLQKTPRTVTDQQNEWKLVETEVVNEAKLWSFCRREITQSMKLAKAFQRLDSSSFVILEWVQSTALEWVEPNFG